MNDFHSTTTDFVVVVVILFLRGILRGGGGREQGVNCTTRKYEKRTCKENEKKRRGVEILRVCCGGDLIQIKKNGFAFFHAL